MSDPSDLALRNLQRLIANDPLLRDIVQPTLPRAKGPSRFAPEVDVLESDAGWTLVLDLPGVPKDAVHIDIDGSRLTIRGERPVRVVEGTRQRVGERATGRFLREFLVPFQVAPERITARLTDGVLTVTLPREGERDKRTVPIV